MLKKISIFLSIVSTCSLWAVTSPSSLKLKVYQIAVALSDDCSSPIVLFTSTTGQEQNFLANPSLGRGSLDDGTYNCIMITMDDVIKFTPLVNDGATCTGGTEYSIDLCRTTATSNGEVVWSTTDLLEGTTTTSTECAGTSQVVGAGGVANKVTLYLRTNAVLQSNGNSQYTGSWLKGTTTAFSVDSGAGPSVNTPNGIQLASPFVVSGGGSGIFYVDATGQVTGAGANCEMNAPEFGFR